MVGETQVRLALFGPGGFGYERARALRASPHVEFAKCYSPVESERLACQAEFGARSVASEDAIWNDPSIDGVILSTPNHIHLAHTRLAAEAGKHVFVEKPIAPTVSEARQMIEICQKKGTVLMVGHNSRRRKRIRTMKRYINEGQLGQVLAVESHNSHSGGVTIQPGDWRWHRSNCPGGPLSQLGIHHADTLQYLLGPVARVLAWQRRLMIPAEIDDTTMTLLEFESGALGYLGSNYAIPHLRYVNILGTTGNMRWERGTGLIYEQEDGLEKVAVEENDTVQEEIDEFAQCILTGQEPEVGGNEALAALALIEAAILSNERSQPVEIAEVLS